MKRRTFLQVSSVSGLTVLAGCSATHATMSDAGPEPDASHPRVDGGTLEQDAPNSVDTGAARFVITESFDVVLSDTTCSGHQHNAHVLAGTYNEDVLVHFNGGGGHGLNFRASELVRLQAGEALPFATNGLGGHGHCGTAWRSSHPPATMMERQRFDMCDLIAPATNVQCESRPRP